MLLDSIPCPGSFDPITLITFCLMVRHDGTFFRIGVYVSGPSVATSGLSFPPLAFASRFRMLTRPRPAEGSLQQDSGEVTAH